MKVPENYEYTSHESVSLLLPWYANDSLDDTERRIVEDHLSVCLPCRSELNSQRYIAGIIQSRDETLVGVDNALSIMRRRIRPARRSKTNRLHDWMSIKLTAPAWVWASGAAIAMAAFVFIPLLVSSEAPTITSGDFRTLSTSNAHLKFQENSLRLLFIEGLSDDTRNSIVRMINPVKVSLPSPRGVLTVQVMNGELDSALELLRNREEVVLAERVYSPLNADEND